MGYYRAGFTEIVGIDIAPQPSTCDRRTNTYQGAAGCLARLRQVRQRAVGSLATREAAESEVLFLRYSLCSSDQKVIRGLAASPLEGWAFQDQGWLHRGLAFSRKSVRVHAKQGWICVRASLGNGEEAKKTAAKNRRSSPPRRPKIGQSNQQSQVDEQVRSCQRTAQTTKSLKGRSPATAEVAG